MNAKEKIELAIASVEAETDFAIISEMKAALNSVYGEERNQIARPSYESIMQLAKERSVDSYLERRLSECSPSDVVSYLRMTIDTCLCYQIIIHFPEITIKNDGHKHLIRDIYVRLFVKPNGLLFTYLQGMRTTLTEAEFLSHYLHSHLPALNASSIRFGYFCTGIGEINQVLAVLNSRYTSANFVMLLMHIKNFLEWESKEGHPHMFMENVFVRSSNMSIHNILPDYLTIAAANEMLNEIMGKLTVSEIMKLFNFEVTERGIKASSTIELEKWMAGIIERWDVIALFNSRHSNTIFMSLRDNAGVYYAIPESATRINYERGPILNFKGKDIEFEVIERSQTQTNETFANPKITRETCKKLSRLLTRTALASTGIKSGSSLIYNSRTAETSQVSVQGGVDRGMVGDALLSD